MTRDGVIKQLADAVGPAHKVDLKHYDLLILVEIYKVREWPCPILRAVDFEGELSLTIGTEHLRYERRR